MIIMYAALVEMMVCCVMIGVAHQDPHGVDIL